MADTSPDVVSNVVLGRDYFALMKFWHAVDALYMWEFVTTLNYEWSIIRGRRPYRWTIWIYSLTRVATLVAAILNLVGLDAISPINCQLWAVFNFIFAYLGFACSSLLVVIRAIAIWNKNKIVVALAAIVWLVNVSFLSEGIARIRAGWDPDQGFCVVSNVESNQPTMIVMLITDVVLLLTMFVGLLRLRRRGGGTFELGRLLWKQGVIWLLLGTATELTPVLFISLYLTDALNIMFLMPSLLTMSIAATRMYRALADFSSTEITNVSDSRQKCIPSVTSNPTATTTTKQSSVMPTTSDPTGAGVRMVFPSDEYPRLEPNRYVPSIDLDRYPSGQSPGLSSFDEDIEKSPTARPVFGL